MNKVAFAVATHPDDIEFMMAGTLMQLGHAGYELHYMNLANGSCGTATLDRDEIVAIRTEEARQAAASIGAVFHPPLADDLAIYYEPILVARLCAVMREVQPQILLLPSPQDYMEDHTNTSRIAVTAAFCRGMRNFITQPQTEPAAHDMALYHAMPYGLQDQLRHPVYGDFYVDVSQVMEKKHGMLACHRSQKEWLDHSQGIDSYLNMMELMTRQMGEQSGSYTHAEGWRRHAHMGFGPEDYDPLRQALSGLCTFDS